MTASELKPFSKEELDEMRSPANCGRLTKRWLLTLEAARAPEAKPAESKFSAEDAAEHLRNHQKQLDADGIMVGVSRQALDEVLHAAADQARELEAEKELHQHYKVSFQEAEDRLDELKAKAITREELAKFLCKLDCKDMGKPLPCECDCYGIHFENADAILNTGAVMVKK